MAVYRLHQKNLRESCGKKGWTSFEKEKHWASLKNLDVVGTTGA